MWCAYIAPERVVIVASEELFVSWRFMDPGGFTSVIEGPACDADGNLYAVNFERQDTIGKAFATGDASLFLELPNDSIGNGIRFNRAGTLFITESREIST